MVSRLRRRSLALHRKLHILRILTKSKSVKRSSIIMDAFTYIYKLKLQVEAIKRESQHLSIDHHIQEVKVENVGTSGNFKVTIACKKKGDQELLVSILEEFDKMNVNVLHTRVSCNHFFGMEAIVEANNIDATILRDAIVHVIQKPKY